MTAGDVEPSLTKAEARLLRAEAQRADAAKVRNEIAAATVERDAKIVRLRALRLAKEAADRAARAARPPEPKRRARKKAPR